MHEKPLQKCIAIYTHTHMSSQPFVLIKAQFRYVAMNIFGNPSSIVHRHFFSRLSVKNSALTNTTTANTITYNHIPKYDESLERCTMAKVFFFIFVFQLVSFCSFRSGSKMSANLFKLYINRQTKASISAIVYGGRYRLDHLYIYQIMQNPCYDELKALTPLNYVSAQFIERHK